MESSDDKLRELMKKLADTIGQAFSGNKEIRQALSMIEEQGYNVDVILASVTCLSRKEESKTSDTKITDYDKSFLERIRLRFGED